MIVAGILNPFKVGAPEAPTVVSEVSDTKTVSAGAEDPWDETITVPAGNNRMLIYLVQVNNPGVHNGALDPAGANIALVENANSPEFFSAAGENVVAYHLLEAALPAASPPDKTIRINWPSTRNTIGHVIFVEDAEQTIYTAGNAVDNNGVLTISVTHPTGNFGAGALVYVGMHAEASAATYTVSGDAAEVDDEATVDGDRWVFAKGTLAAPKATVSVTFTRDVFATVRKQAILYVVDSA